MEVAARDDAVGGREFVRLQIRREAQPVVDRAEVPIAGLEQPLETVDDEIALLKIVDDVFGAHHPLEIEGDAVRRRILDREDRLGGR